jgi:hypothetical protein
MDEAIYKHVVYHTSRACASGWDLGVPGKTAPDGLPRQEKRLLASHRCVRGETPGLPLMLLGTIGLSKGDVFALHLGQPRQPPATTTAEAAEPQGPHY